MSNFALSAHPMHGLQPPKQSKVEDRGPPIIFSYESGAGAGAEGILIKVYTSDRINTSFIPTRSPTPWPTELSEDTRLSPILFNGILPACHLDLLCHGLLDR